MVAYYPQILTVPVKRVKTAVGFLREKCLFTVQQVTDILRDSPAVLTENLGQLEYKFQVSTQSNWDRNDTPKSVLQTYDLRENVEIQQIFWFVDHYYSNLKT